MLATTRVRRTPHDPSAVLIRGMNSGLLQCIMCLSGNPVPPPPVEGEEFALRCAGCSTLKCVLRRARN